MDIQLEDRFLKNYPVIIPDYPTDDSYFVDTTIINNSYTGSLGADFSVCL